MSQPHHRLAMTISSCMFLVVLSACGGGLTDSEPSDNAGAALTNVEDSYAQDSSLAPIPESNSPNNGQNPPSQYAGSEGDEPAYQNEESNPPPPANSSGEPEPESGEPESGEPGPVFVPPVVSEPSTFSGPIPAWREGMNRWQWTQIAGTDISTAAPTEPRRGRHSYIIGAWNGMAADRSTNRLFIAGSGGHADYDGNEAYSINLSEDNPSWTRLNEPTPMAQVVENASYYADGRPSSTHTYYATQFVGRLSRVFRVGSGSNWGNGNYADWRTNAFNITVNDWDPAGTWPDVDGLNVLRGTAICMDPVTEDIYASARTSVRKFSVANGTWTSVAAFPANGTSTYTKPCAVDPVRRKVVFLADRYNAPNGGLVFNLDGAVLTPITFTGPSATEMTGSSGAFAWFDPIEDAILVITGVGDRVLRVDPETYSVTAQGTIGGESMPNATNGVWTRWQYLPGLGGYAYYPKAGDGVWFLATE